jgi:hypothetical protein
MRLAFTPHVVLVDAMSEMQEPAHFDKVIGSASSVMLLFYTTVSVVAYAYAGSEVVTPITNQLASGPLLAVVNAALFVHVCVSLLINSTILNKWTLNALNSCINCGQSRRAWLLVSIFTLSYAFLISQAIPLFGDLMNVLGATFGVLTAYIIPCR